MELKLQTDDNRQVIDITDQVEKVVEPDANAVVVFAMHTTCVVTVADLDPGMDKNLLDAAWEMIPKLNYHHPHNPAHAPAHLASALMGPGTTVPLQNGKLALGTWQRIIFMEFDGPQERSIFVTSLR